jgi:hypothetical protein
MKSRRKKAPTKSEALGQALARCRSAINAYYLRTDVFSDDVETLLACIVLTAPARTPDGALESATRARGAA